MQEQKHIEAGEEVMQRQREIQQRLAAVAAHRTERAKYVEWLSKQVETQLVEKVGRRIVLPSEFLF
jgi:RNA-binding protein YhbY